MDLDTYTEVHTQMQTDRHSLLSLLDRFLWEFGSWCRYSSRFSPFILSHWLRLASPGPCATGRRHSSCVSNLSGLWHASATDIPYIYICIYVYIPYSSIHLPYIPYVYIPYLPWPAMWNTMYGTYWSGLSVFSAISYLYRSLPVKHGL